MVTYNLSECDEKEIAHTIAGLIDPDLRVVSVFVRRALQCRSGIWDLRVRPFRRLCAESLFIDQLPA